MELRQNGMESLEVEWDFIHTFVKIITQKDSRFYAIIVIWQKHSMVPARILINKINLNI